MRRARTADRIVIVNWRDGRHPQSGGAELYCERVAEELGRTGERVTLLTSRPPGLPVHERRDHYDVVRGGGTYGVYAHSLLWLLRHRRTVGGVVDSQNGIPFFSPLAVARRTPVLLLLHHVHQQQFGAHFGPAMARVGRWLEGPASRLVYGRRLVVAVSPSTRAGARRQLGLRGVVVVLPCGMDGPAPRPPQRSPIPRIVVVGRLVVHKRLDRVLDAVAEAVRHLPEVQLHVVGDGPTRAALEARGAHLVARGSLVFHGRVPDEERDRLLASAWLTVSASPGEGWGLSVIEANAAGVPAVAYRVTGLQDSVRHGQTGWLVDPAEDDGLARAVVHALRVLSDPAEARRFGDRARDWAAHFSWERTAQGVRAALVVEHRRLRLGPQDRRGGNDVVSLVDVPERAMPLGWQQHLRSSDSWTTSAGVVHGLLPGADPADAAGLLQRLGVDRAEAAVRIVVARPSDLLGQPAAWWATAS